MAHRTQSHASMSLTEHLDRLPPCIVRLVARRRGKRLPLHELVERSGLAYGTIQRLSVKVTWADTPPRMIDAFCRACNVDIVHPRATLKYLRKVLRDPNGYCKLSDKSGPGSPKNVLKLLQKLSE